MDRENFLSQCVLAVSGFCLFLYALRAEPRISQAMVAAHNRVRARLGVPSLVWSERLAEIAQQWAERLAATGAFHPDPRTSFGQNLFEIAGGHATPEQVVEAWASEARNYDYRTNTCRARCGHYTQLVWRDTKRVGCGMARQSQVEIWVCDYDPPGNVLGEKPY
jgi:pathogenesis-related protein 1